MMTTKPYLPSRLKFRGSKSQSLFPIRWGGTPLRGITMQLRLNEDILLGELEESVWYSICHDTLIYGFLKVAVPLHYSTGQREKGNIPKKDQKTILNIWKSYLPLSNKTWQWKIPLLASVIFPLVRGLPIHVAGGYYPWGPLDIWVFRAKAAAAWCKQMDLFRWRRGIFGDQWNPKVASLSLNSSHVFWFLQNRWLIILSPEKTIQTWTNGMCFPNSIGSPESPAVLHEFVKKHPSDPSSSGMFMDFPKGPHLERCFRISPLCTWAPGCHQAGKSLEQPKASRDLCSLECVKRPFLLWVHPHVSLPIFREFRFWFLSDTWQGSSSEIWTNVQQT